MFPFRFLVAFLIYLPAACALPQALAQTTCAEVVAKLQQFQRDAAAANGCPGKPTSGSKIPKQLQDTPPDTTATTCVPDLAAAEAWWAAHRADYNALMAKLNQLGCVPPCGPVAPAKPIQTCRPGLKSKDPVCTTKTDDDGDGIPDDLEAALIARFSPYLRFSLADPFGPPMLPEVNRPIDPIQYIRHSDLVIHKDGDHVLIPNSQLRADPGLVLSTHALGRPANILDSYAFYSCAPGFYRSEYAIQGSRTDGTDAGADWATVTASRHVGLFAHVSPFQPDHSNDLPSQAPRMKNGKPVTPRSAYEDLCQTELCYKLEYYQFFAKNNDHTFANIGDHQADLSILTAVYSRTRDRLLAISHWAHGYEMRYDLVTYATFVSETDPQIGKQITYSGPNAKYTDFQILYVNLFTGAHQDEPEKAQNNKVSLAADPNTGEYSHPVVFVEHGSHEFWPTKDWSAEDAPTHNGLDAAHSYLTANIPNLGEIEHPLSSDAAIFIQFNGYWGDRNSHNDVSPGPSMHQSWNWWIPNFPPIPANEAER